MCIATSLPQQKYQQQLAWLITGGAKRSIMHLLFQEKQTCMVAVFNQNQKSPGAVFLHCPPGLNFHAPWIARIIRQFFHSIKGPSSLALSHSIPLWKVTMKPLTID